MTFAKKEHFMNENAIYHQLNYKICWQMWKMLTFYVQLLTFINFSFWGIIAPFYIFPTLKKTSQKKYFNKKSTEN